MMSFKDERRNAGKPEFRSRQDLFQPEDKDFLQTKQSCELVTSDCVQMNTTERPQAEGTRY